MCSADLGVIWIMISILWQANQAQGFGMQDAQEEITKSRQPGKFGREIWKRLVAGQWPVSGRWGPVVAFC